MGYHHFIETGPAPRPHLEVTCVYCGKVDKRTEAAFDPQNPLPLEARIRRTISTNDECKPGEDNGKP